MYISGLYNINNEDSWYYEFYWKADQFNKTDGPRQLQSFISVLKGMLLTEWSSGMNKTQVQYDDKREGGNVTTSGWQILPSRLEVYIKKTKQKTRSSEASVSLLQPEWRIQRCLVEPALSTASVVDQLIFLEPQRDLLLGTIHWVTAVDDVPVKIKDNIWAI